MSFVYIFGVLDSSALRDQMIRTADPVPVDEKLRAPLRLRSVLLFTRGQRVRIRGGFGGHLEVEV